MISTTTCWREGRWLSSPERTGAPLSHPAVKQKCHRPGHAIEEVARLAACLAVVVVVGRELWAHTVPQVSELSCFSASFPQTQRGGLMIRLLLSLNVSASLSSLLLQRAVLVNVYYEERRFRYPVLEFTPFHWFPTDWLCSAWAATINWVLRVQACSGINQCWLHWIKPSLPDWRFGSPCLLWKAKLFKHWLVCNSIDLSSVFLFFAFERKQTWDLLQSSKYRLPLPSLLSVLINLREG